MAKMKYEGFPDIKIRNIRSRKNDLVFTYKNERGTRRNYTIKDFPWYFIMEKSEASKHRDLILKFVRGGLIQKYEKINDQYMKFYADKEGGARGSNANYAMQELERAGAVILEGDFHSAKRFVADYECEVSDEYDILYFDIETDDSNGKIEIGATKILSVAAIDNYGNEYYNDTEYEGDLLDWTAKLFSKYDVLAGWNIGSFNYNPKDLKVGFDIPYIMKRAEIYKTKFDDRNYATIDMLARARKVWKENNNIKSYSLESVSQYFLKKGKVPRTGRIIDMYHNDREKFKEYNLTDVRLLKELDEKTQMISLIGTQCQMSRTLIRDFKGLYISMPIDNLIIQHAHERGIYVPSKKAKFKEDVVGIEKAETEDEGKYAGGLVYDPITGLHKDVYVFDFKSLYPSIITTSNIGFDSIVKFPQTGKDLIKNPGTGINFRKDYKSVVATSVEKLVEARQKYKDLRLQLTAEHKMDTEEYQMARANEIAIKEFANSLYGVIGNKYSRWYSVETAESITMTGQYLLKWTYEWFNRNGWKSIYGDTDSIFAVPPIPAEEIIVENWLKSYHQELNEHLATFGITESAIYLKYEKLFKSLCMIKKKLYCGYVTNIEGKEVNEFVAKGIDIVKKATNPIVLEVQKTVIDMVLADAPEEELLNYVWGFEKRILNDPFTFDQIKIQRNVNRALDEYTAQAQNQPHVKIAQRILKREGTIESREIEYVYVDHKQGILAERFEFDGNFDRKHFWNENIIPPVLRILEAAFPGTDWYGKFKISAIPGRTMPIGQQNLF